mmetsp:Transcript_52281/g.96290  ORF Transcript_52281/g.96290 Transcript_52281/m.96290 type:complete len:385 (-) Transcript_52281:38-1192(-)
MGCRGSKAGAAEDQLSGPRRRLSLSQVEQKADLEGLPDEDRGLIGGWSSDGILELFGNAQDRKFSLASSQTDNNETSFANKSMQQLGGQLDPVNCGYGYTCRKGLKPESPNQDSWTIMKVDGDFSIYGVFDGHGQAGHDVSNFVKETMPKLIVKDGRFKTAEQPRMLADVFKKTQSLVATSDKLNKLRAQMSGTTATVAIQDHINQKLTLAHVADSSAVLGTFTTPLKQAIRAIRLTRDHKPNLQDEKERIESNGGRVVFDGYKNHRVFAKKGRYPGLNMSRCIGDLLGHMDAGLTCAPEVTEKVISPLDHVLLICSDGVWEFIEPLEAVDIVTQYPAEKAIQAAERLAKEAWDRWILEEGGAVVDDITVVVIFLQHRPRRFSL